MLFLRAKGSGLKRVNLLGRERSFDLITGEQRRGNRAKSETRWKAREKKRRAMGEAGKIGEAEFSRTGISAIAWHVATKLRGKGRLHSRAAVADEQPGPLSYVIS